MKPKKLTPREAAKNFIRPYFEKSDTLSLHPHFNPKIETKEFSARMKNTQEIVVTKLYGKEMNEEFSLKGIFLNLLNEHREKISKRTPESCYMEKEKEILRFLKLFKAKFNEHRRQFRKDRENWGFVGDLSKWIETLNEIV